MAVAGTAVMDRKSLQKLLYEIRAVSLSFRSDLNLLYCIFIIYY
jgi:hypothetical protein